MPASGNETRSKAARRLGWFVALPAVAVLAAGATVLFEARRVAHPVHDAGEPAAPPERILPHETALNLPRVEPFVWSATRGADGVSLDGYVPSESARTRFVTAIREAADGAPLEDRTQLADGLPEGVDPAALARLAGGVLGLLAEGRIDLAGDRLSLSGLAVDEDAASEIEARLGTDLPAAGLQRGVIAVRTEPLSPYRAVIRRETGQVILAGHLPDATARTVLLDAMRGRFFGERILDRTRLAPGAPAGLGAALLTGLDALALLATGEVSAEGSTLTLAGESLYRGTARRLREGLRTLPTGWTQSVTVRGPPAPETLAAPDCRARLADARAPIRFAPGSADLEPAAYPYLDTVANLAQLCPQARVEVAGLADPAEASPRPAPTTPPTPSAAPPSAAASKPATLRAGAAKKETAGAAKNAGAKREPAKDEAAAADQPDADLPRRRATAVVDYLVKAGVPSDRALVAPTPASGAVSGTGQVVLGQVVLGMRS